MPTKIHYGPVGSYKTAGAMADDFLREARAGRVIVTNVRGVSRERTLEEFPDLPDSFDVIHVDDKTTEGREKWAKWFHWVPKGAFIFLDEVQDLWPKRWRDADIKALDYPGGVEAAAAADRPYCWDQALDKHRHWNWDIVCTTPSYKKVRDDVKGVADAAYKHKDLALIGWTGRYIEAMHLADDEGKSQADFLNVVKKKVPKYVFRLYDSTATGQHRTTANGFNMFASPRVLLLLGVLALALYFGFGRGNDFKLFPGAPAVAVAPGVVASAPGAPASVPAPVRVVGGGDNLRRPAAIDGPLGPFEGDGVFIVASVRVGDVWKYAVSFAGTEYTNGQMLDMGYALKTFGACGLEISRGDWSRFVTCGRSREAQQQVARSDRPNNEQGQGGMPIPSQSVIRGEDAIVVGKVGRVS